MSAALIGDCAECPTRRYTDSVAYVAHRMNVAELSLAPGMLSV
jgi:hypothetical protein